MPRPKGYVQSPETRAKISAANRARWAGPEREALLAHIRSIGRQQSQISPDVRPLYNKLRGYFRSNDRAREEIVRMRGAY